VRRAAAIASIAALASSLAACAGEGSNGGGETTLTVYVSAPLSGQRVAEGRAVVRGAKLALADAGGRVGDLRVRAVYLDDSAGGRWSLARTATNARRAAEDSAAIGFLGDLDSGASRVSLPITNQAEIAQISAGSTAVDLTRLPPAGSGDPERYRPSERQTFARVVPADDVQARAAAIWARQLGARQVSVVGDGSAFGEVLSSEFKDEAARLGLGVGEPRHADLLYYAGGPERFRAAMTGLPAKPVIGSDALAGSAALARAAALTETLYVMSPFLDPSLLPGQGRRFVRSFQARYGSAPEPGAAYGYEAMALLLDAIRRAGDDGDSRGAVIDQLLATQDRHSVLGVYSIDGNGDTTLDAVSGYRIADGLPVSPVRLQAP
jgi:branched-chain amino acid transport system substrate-binding protein